MGVELEQLETNLVTLLKTVVVVYDFWICTFIHQQIRPREGVLLRVN